jgi:hypothetical protein
MTERIHVVFWRSGRPFERGLARIDVVVVLALMLSGVLTPHN